MLDNLGQFFKRGSEDVSGTGLRRGISFKGMNRNGVRALTIFSITHTTLSVSLCARLIESATFFSASDFVHAPTVDPGLAVEVVSLLRRIKPHR